MRQHAENFVGAVFDTKEGAGVGSHGKQLKAATKHTMRIASGPGLSWRPFSEHNRDTCKHGSCGVRRCRDSRYQFSIRRSGSSGGRSRAL